MPRTLTTEHRRVLGILAGCPDGATVYCLTQLNAASLRTIVELVQHGLADARYQQVAARSSTGEAITVIRLHITAAGRRVLAGKQPGRTTW